MVRGSGLYNGLPVGIVEKPVALNQDVKAIEVDKSLVDPWFLLYWIIGNKSLLDSKLEATGIGAGKFDINILKDLDVWLPSLAVQRKVASIARCWDDKIELNRQMNQTLEQMAQTLFRQYFVEPLTLANQSESALSPSEHEKVPLGSLAAEALPLQTGKKMALPCKR